MKFRGASLLLFNKSGLPRTMKGYKHIPKGMTSFIDEPLDENLKEDFEGEVDDDTCGM
jgi:hypothetical protein